MPKAKVFASLRQVVGASEIDVPGITVGELLKAAVERYGDEFERQVPHCTVLVNGRGISEDELDTPIADGDEIAILPPVGGGTATV